jgi:uncharacterized protein YjiS (DUF1127 family)
MANVIYPRLGAAEPARRGLSPAARLNRVAGRLLGTIAAVIRRELAARELRRLDDRLLRDVGLDREDVMGIVWPSRGTVAWDARTGSHLLGAPGP